MTMRMGPIGEDRLKTGVQSVQHSPKKGSKVVKNPVYEKADYWVVKLAIANHGKPRVENHAKGGYHAALSNARIS